MAVRADFEYACVRVQGARGAEILVLADELVAACLARYGLEGQILGRCAGAALEGLQLEHPWLAKHVPVILGDHVTLEAGTGRRAHRAGARPGGLRDRQELRPAGGQSGRARRALCAGDRTGRGAQGRCGRARDHREAARSAAGWCTRRRIRTAIRTAGATRRR